MPAACLFAVGAEIIVVHGHRTVSVNCNVRGLVDQKVVSWTLPDNSEVVYERGIELAIL